MAEIGLVASVVGVACAGIKLSTTLYTFSETVAAAADSIKAIAKDVSLTSAVLEELSSNLKHDEQARLYSGAALKTAETLVGDCEAVFKQIDGALSKSMERISVMARSRNRHGRGGKVVLSAVERLKWSFLQPKMQELRANLERLKSTLVLMLNVLAYARNVQVQKERQPPKDDYQRLLIENLVAANQEATRNFQTLMRTIGPGDETNSMTTTSTKEHSIRESVLGDQKEPSDLVPPTPAFNSEASLKQTSAPKPSAGGLSRNIAALEDNGGITQFAISDTALATETTMACLKRIQQALDHFEASEENLKSARQIAVSIEVYKHILHGDLEARTRKPWKIAYIKRREDEGLKDEPYDLTIFSGGPLDPGSAQVGGHRRNAALQAQIGRTISIMHENIEKVSNRGERLDQLQDMSGSLSASAQGFEKGAHRARKQRRWLSMLGNAWNNLPSPTAALASANEFLQEKFAAAFHEEPPEVGVGTSLPPSDVSGLDVAMPAPLDLQSGLPQETPVGKDDKKGSITPTHANAFRPDPYAIRGEIPPITVPSKNPAYLPPISRMSMSPPETSDLPEHSSSSPPPPAPDKFDAASANQTEIENAATRIEERKDSMRRNSRASPSQGDTVLINYLEPDRPNIAYRASEIALKEASETASEDDDASVSGLDLRTEVGADAVPSLEFLLKEWTTLYDRDDK